MNAEPRRGAPTAIVVAGLSADRYEPVGAPDGPPIVIVHGAMDRAAGFRRTARHLPDRLIVAYDRRGYAGSRDVAVATDIGVHVDDLVEVCETAAAEAGPVLIVGHSAGGLIALHALTCPGIQEHVVGAVVWEAPLAFHDWYRSRGDGLLDLPPEKAAAAFMRGVLGDRLWDRLPAAMKAERCAEGPALVSDMRNARDPSAAVDFDRIELPVLVGCGSESGEHHRRSAAEAAAAIAGARLVTVEGAGHGIHLDRPTAFAELIGSWG